MDNPFTTFNFVMNKERLCPSINIVKFKPILLGLFD